jgi:hypothetical protein
VTVKPTPKDTVALDADGFIFTGEAAGTASPPHTGTPGIFATRDARGDQ